MGQAQRESQVASSVSQPFYSPPYTRNTLDHFLCAEYIGSAISSHPGFEVYAWCAVRDRFLF